MRRFVRIVVVAVTAVLASTSCSGLRFLEDDDSVPFRPSTAATADAADCLAEDIYTNLTGLGPWDPAITPAAPRPGYPPPNFDPVAVVRCELGQNDDGIQTVDSVRLEGGVGGVLDAYSVESQRFPDNVQASCVFLMTAPAGLWLVDDAGHAFRPEWPSLPCGGFQEQPLGALRALNEVARSTHPTGIPASSTFVCASDDGQRGGGFTSTTVEDVAESEERDRTGNGWKSPTFATPTDDVGALHICRYPAYEEPAFDGAGSPLVLPRPDSITLANAVVDAPIAPACATRATRIATTYLLRPDGSGGSPVSFELDGCKRVMGFGPYRQASDDIVEALSRH